MISDGDVYGAVDKSTVNFGLQIENGKGYLSNFENVVPIVIYFDALAAGDGGGCSVGNSSIVSHGHTLQAVPDVSNVVSSCFVGSLN